MRKRGAVLVAAALAACSGDGGSPAPSAASTTSPVAGDAAPRTRPSGVDEAAADEPTPKPTLPGLLDTTDADIPGDPEVRTGVLANGLTYYVRRNDNPGGKADLRLAVRAGSVDELGDETGVAHFVEHMLFNGTERFPENELIDVLRSFGAAFGADVNAYTSFDETVYTLTVPSADESVETGLTVLEQWLSHATFADEQVVAERGVVLDEWRVRTQSTQGRLFDVAEGLFLADTAYAGRSPIGTDDSIAGMGRATLVDYYDTWYRPDNAGIIVVGDIDVDGIVADIERLFGTAAADGSLPAGPDTTFDVDDEPAVGIHVDPDQQTVDVEVTLPLPAVTGRGTLPARARLIDAMIADALVRRLRQDVADGTAPFDDVVQGGNSFVEGLDAPALYAFTDADRAEATLQSLLDEYARAARHGFTEAETELARDGLRSFFETRYAGRESTQDRAYADALVDAFLHDEPYPSIADEFDIATTILDGTTADALTARFRARWANSAPHVIISAPSAVAARIPTEARVLELVAASADRDVEPRADRRELPPELMARPEGQAPLRVERVVDNGDSLFDPLRLEYPNGVVVILNGNAIVEAQVFFQGASPGGSSLVADEDVVDARYAPDVVVAGGVAEFDPTEVDEIIAGTDTQVAAWIDPYVEHFAGAAATADVEVLFQRLHLYMTRPRFDPVALRQVRSRVGPLVADPGSDASAAADDALADLRYGGEPRYDPLPTPEQFDTLDLAGVERVWRDRFGNASDWVFVFSGDFDVDEVADLADSYFGTLPGDGGVEEWVDVEEPPPPGIARADVVAGTGETASVAMLFTSEVDDIDARLRVTADVVTDVVQARLTDVVREELGESYSPSAVSFVATDPDPVIQTYVFVTGSPDRVDAIAEVVVAELDDLGSRGPGDREFSNAVAQVEEALNFVNNGAFVQELLDDEIHPDRDLDDYLFELAALSSVTADDVRSYIDEHVPADRYVQVTVEPR